MTRGRLRVGDGGTARTTRERRIPRSAGSTARDDSSGRGVPAEPRGRRNQRLVSPIELKEPLRVRSVATASRRPPRRRACARWLLPVRVSPLVPDARLAPRNRGDTDETRAGGLPRGAGTRRGRPRESQPLRGRRIIMRRANHLTGSDSILGRFIRPSRTQTRPTARSEQPCRSVGFYPLPTNRRNHRSKSTAGVSPIDQGPGHHQNRRASRQSPPRKAFLVVSHDPLASDPTRAVPRPTRLSPHDPVSALGSRDRYGPLHTRHVPRRRQRPWALPRQPSPRDPRRRGAKARMVPDHLRDGG